MSEFKVSTVTIGEIRKHPDADTLSITEVDGFPVVFRTGEFQPGSPAVYIPVDAVVDLTKPYFAFLAKGTDKRKHRIKAIRLRGVFSMGLLIPFPEGCPVVGAADWLGVVKYEEPQLKTLGGEGQRPPENCPSPYDLESWWRYRDILQEGEHVVITEKIHGCNARFCWVDGQFYAGSHRMFWKETPGNIWWRAARQYDIDERMPEGFMLYGEVFGDIQDLRYGAQPGSGTLSFRAFDVQDLRTRHFLNHSEFERFCELAGIPTVPVLWRGPYDADKAYALAQGRSVMAQHMKEGIVIKADPFRFSDIGRPILKLHSEAYLTRKGGTEQH